MKCGKDGSVWGHVSTSLISLQENFTSFCFLRLRTSTNNNPSCFSELTGIHVFWFNWEFQLYIVLNTVDYSRLQSLICHQQHPHPVSTFFFSTLILYAPFMMIQRICYYYFFWYLLCQS